MNKHLFLTPAQPIGTVPVFLMILLLKYRYSFYFVKPKKFPFFKWQYRAGAGAEAKIMGKVEPDSNIFGSATLFFFLYFSFFMPQRVVSP